MFAQAVKLRQDSRFQGAGILQGCHPGFLAPAVGVIIKTLIRRPVILAPNLLTHFHNPVIFQFGPPDIFIGIFFDDRRGLVDADPLDDPPGLFIGKGGMLLSSAVF